MVDGRRRGKRRLGSTVGAVVALLAVVAGVRFGSGLVDFGKLGLGATPMADSPAASTPPRSTPSVSVRPTPAEPFVPDAALVRNKLYSAGRLASAGCAEPSQRLTSKAAVLKYAQAMLPCLNKSWAPLVRRAGYEFQAPAVVVFTRKVDWDCTSRFTRDRAFYCTAQKTIFVSWEDYVAAYRYDSLDARVDLLQTVAHEYAHHVQWLVAILATSDNRQNWAASKAAGLLESRRLELQASCLGAAYIGANASALGVKGRKLTVWNYEAKHLGDEYDPDKIRYHGSRKNHWRWMGPAFKSADPKSCNTFTAPTAKVS
jgi:predicted metalloprotease